MALVHQYLQPNGTLGGRGRPDPKRLFVEGEIFIPIHEETSREPGYMLKLGLALAEALDLLDWLADQAVECGSAEALSVT